MITKTHMNILIAANTTWYIHNFRSRLIAALIERGHLVTALAPRDEYVSRIDASGARHLHLELDRAGVNPFSELCTLAHLATLLRREKPTLILTNTTKGNIFVSLAARLLGIPVVTNISGLGRAYIAGGWLKTITRQLYKMAMKHPRLIFFQNEDDRKEFTRGGIVDWDKTARLPGSGVDLERFAPAVTRSAGRHFVFLLAARLLWDKGVGEFVQAARQVKSRYPETEFRLLGFLDVQNPSAIPRAVIESWETEGVVRYLGSTDEVRQYYTDADCVVFFFAGRFQHGIDHHH
jgi:glycosyltransferase involved in cell wall biosynthesis